MQVVSPFKPHYGTNQIVTPAAGAASISLDKNDTSVRIINSGANIGYFRLGLSPQTATTADCPVNAGQTIVVEKAMATDTLSHISSAGTTFQVMTGEGGL